MRRYFAAILLNGLRDYGTEPLIWDADASCDHEWGSEQTKIIAIADMRAKEGHSSDRDKLMDGQIASQGQWCQKCTAWRGHLGLEPTPELYVQHLVQIFRELRRVLRKDGTFWLNIGDSYAANGISGLDKQTDKSTSGKANPRSHQKRNVPSDCKSKDLIGIPWMLAFALRADGWYVRSEIIWSKANPMPESVRDRPTCAHEKIFLLTKSDRYFYDHIAVAEPANYAGSVVSLGPKSLSKGQSTGANVRPSGNALSATVLVGETRNIRNVWHLTHEPVAEAHFACFPSKIPQTAIMAGTSERGCCAQCGAPWQRVVESVEEQQEADGFLSMIGLAEPQTKTVKRPTWRAGCECNTDVVSCTVIDPFNGAGTTGIAASRLGRNYIGIELNPEYVEITEKRLDKRAGLFMDIAADG